MSCPRLLAVALVVAMQAGPWSTTGLCQAYFGPQNVVTMNRMFANDEATFWESLLGSWSGSHGYEIRFERRFSAVSAREHAVEIRTSRDSSARTIRSMALLFGPMSCAGSSRQASRALYVLEVTAEHQGDLAGGWLGDYHWVPVYEHWMVEIVGRQLRIDFLNSELGEAMMGGRMWFPTLKTERQGIAILNMEPDAARAWLEWVLCARLVGKSPRLLQRR